MAKVIVVIPSYNEARSIGRIVKELKDKNLPVCVIDDGSTDETAVIAEKAGAVVIRNPINKGKGAALREGFMYALKEGFSAALVMDGDGQHDPADVSGFLKKMDDVDADIIIGNRMSDTSSMPFVRHATNRVMSFVISLITGQKIEDTQCGFRLIKRRAMENIKLKSSNYEVESELLLKAARKGFRIKSVPVKTVYAGEQSRINPFIDTIRFFALLIRTMVRR